MATQDDQIGLAFTASEVATVIYALIEAQLHECPDHLRPDWKSLEYRLQAALEDWRQARKEGRPIAICPV